MTDTREVTVKVNEDTLHAAMSELYNSGHTEWIADDGTRVTLVSTDAWDTAPDDGDECAECTRTIPATDGGTLDNKHHAPSCSLYNPTEN